MTKRELRAFQKKLRTLMVHADPSSWLAVLVTLAPEQSPTALGHALLGTPTEIEKSPSPVTLHMFMFIVLLEQLNPWLPEYVCSWPPKLPPALIFSFAETVIVTLQEDIPSVTAAVTLTSCTPTPPVVYDGEQIDSDSWLRALARRVCWASTLPAASML